MKSGIYTITNLVNNKMYIGCATYLLHRWNDHRVELQNKEHDNGKLQRAWNKYGEENFEWGVLVECEVEYLFSEEHYWANLLNVHDDRYGYNIRPTHPYGKPGQSDDTIEKIKEKRKLQRYSDESRKKMSDSAKGNKNASNWKPSKGSLEKRGKWGRRSILQYDKNMNFIKEWNSIIEASIVFKIPSSAISAVAMGKPHNNTCAGYIWRYKSDNKRTIVQLTTDYKFIKEWESTAEAVRTTNIKSQGISDSCRNKNRNAGGYKWMYAKDYYNTITENA